MIEPATWGSYHPRRVPLLFILNRSKKGWLKKIALLIKSRPTQGFNSQLQDLIILIIFTHFDWICCDGTEGVCMYVCVCVCMCVRQHRVFLVASRNWKQLYIQCCPSVCMCVCVYVCVSLCQHRVIFAYKSQTDNWIFMIFTYNIDINETKGWPKVKVTRSKVKYAVIQTLFYL